jgi:hypothetical protein
MKSENSILKQLSFAEIVNKSGFQYNANSIVLFDTKVFCSTNHYKTNKLISILYPCNAI